MYIAWLQNELGLKLSDILENNINDSVIETKLQEDFLAYLDKSNSLNKLKDYAVEYSKQLGSQKSTLQPLRCKLVIDVKELLDVSGEFFTNLLFHEPHIAYSVVHNVVHITVCNVENMPPVSSQQIYVSLKLINLPLRPSYWDHSTESSGITVLQGIIVSLSNHHKYVRSSVVKCDESKCVSSLGYRLPGVPNTAHMLCNICGSNMKEDIRARDTGDQILALVANPAAFKYSQQQQFQRSQSVTVCLQDELVHNLHLGAYCYLIGHKQPKLFYAWNIEEMTPLDVRDNLQDLGTPQLPNHISKLFQQVSSDTSYSPWSFVTVLASQIGADLYPASTFMHLKLGMLLNLATQGRGQRTLHLLAVGSDALLAQRLLQRGGQLGERYIEHYSPVFTGPVGGSVHVDDQGLQWTDAGPLLLARKGVCFLGDWDKFSQQTKHSLVASAIETGQISFQTHGGADKGCHIFPLESSIWTYWQHSNSSLRLSDHKQLRMLINIFGIPCLSDDKNQTVEICNYILMRALLTKTSGNVNNDDIREFLQEMSSVNVTLRGDAKQLISSYFVASRRARPDCLPVGAIGTITALAEAHARLSMRTEICYEDVLAVLRLYEESLFEIFGHSFSSPPVTRHGGFLPLKDFIRQTEQEMKEFSVWMMSYIKSIVGLNPSQFLSPEE